MGRMKTARGRPAKRLSEFVCSWCDRKLAPGPAPADRETNYGICDSCLSAELARLETGAGEDATAISASQRATAALG